jgi:hypothetical protein
VTTPTEGAAAAAAAAAASKAEAWNNVAALDPYEQVAKYMQQRTGGGGAGAGEKGGAGKAAPAKGSVQTFNKLAAAAKGKGVQSVASFFGKKP